MTLSNRIKYTKIKSQKIPKYNFSYNSSLIFEINDNYIV